MCAGLLLFSQSGYFFGDESFHLLASQLINAGKRPYVDFFYPHTPLYIYLNAYWMRFFGEGWRSAHVFSALITSACVILVGMFVFGRLEKGKLREPVSIGAALLLALNSLIISCGTIAHPYALCLLFSFASYCFMTAQHFARSATSRLFFSGFCAGVAVSSSLLALPVAVILLLWMLFHLPNENRLKQLTAFIIGGVIPFLPLLWLAGASPRRVFFDVTHTTFRTATPEAPLEVRLGTISGNPFNSQYLPRESC